MSPALAGALAFVAAALLIRRAYRFGSSPVRPAAARRRIAAFATMLMVGAVLVGAVAAQAVFSVRPDHEPLPQPEAAVLGAAVLALGIGIGLRAGSTRERNVAVAGVRGRAFVRSIELAGRGVKGIPIYELDLDVTAPGVEPFRTVYREAIPAVMAQTIEEGRSVPVLVQSETRTIALDWTSPPDDGFGAREPATDVPAPPPPLASPPIGSVPTVAPRVVPVVVTIVLLGLGTTLLNRVFESGDRPAPVAPADYASTELGETPGAAAPSYSFVVPDGWEDVPAAPGERALRSRDGTATLVVSRPPRFNRRPLPPGSDVESSLPALYRELGSTLGRPRPATIDGAPALRFDVRERDVRRALVVVVREGALFFVSATSDADGRPAAVSALRRVLESWTWE